MDSELQKKIADAIANPKNMGEMEGADSVGTVGSPNCGDMVRMWIKFREDNGKKVIDKATFQTFGCETAIAVASLAVLGRVVKCDRLLEMIMANGNLPMVYCRDAKRCVRPKKHVAVARVYAQREKLFTEMLRGREVTSHLIKKPQSP